MLFKISVFIEVQVYNRNLKPLAKRDNLFCPLCNNSRQHTNAQMWIRFGADRHLLFKMLGQEKE